MGLVLTVPLLLPSDDCKRLILAPDHPASYTCTRGESMYADANGIRLHYCIDGREGTPRVTFIAGIANDTTR